MDVLIDEMASSYPSSHEEDTTEYRQRLYTIASAVFDQEPSENDLSIMLDAAFATERPAQTYEDALYAHLRTYKDEPLATLRTRIATEYAELFVGPRKPLAPLYESVYVDPNERLFTQTTMDVRKFYEQQGLQPRQRNKIPDDAMALELEFMAFLCGKELAALQAGDKEEVARIRSTELEFLDKHLNRWARPFAERVAQAWCADYYAAWSRFVADFVEEDRRYLE